MVDSGLVGIKNNPWELGEGNWGREGGRGGVGEWEGGRVGGGWSHSACMEEGELVGWVTR